MFRKAFLIGCLLVAFALPVTAQPQINPLTVKSVAGPNTLGWSVTSRVQQVQINDRGVRVVFDRCASWPEVTPPGWDGPLIYTLHLFLNIGGDWYESGIIQFWACDQFSGGPIYQDNQIARNWVYDNRWSSMVGHQPAPGERIGFMVSAGNARGQDDALVHERSDIVEVAMPTGPGDAPVLAREGVTLLPPVPPAQPPPPVVPPAQPPVTPDLAAQLAFYQSITNARFDKVDAAIAAHVATEEQHWANVKSAVAAVIKNPIFQTVITSLATVAITHQVTK